MRKWYGYDDDKAEDELKQIALERQLLDDSYVTDMTEGDGDGDGSEE